VDLTADSHSAVAGSQATGPVYDEMVTGTGQVRSHWQPLMSRLSPIDPVALEERSDEAAQLVRQRGVTYAAYGDRAGTERPWPLDLIPLVLSSEDWQAIEAGVVQRVRLINAVLGDLYGPGELVASGRIPPALIHANPAFLRPCAGLTPSGGTYLHFSALDLVRGPDARWRILADRTQAPSGAGYALENRGVIGRVLADCIGAGMVRSLSPFFSAFRDSLRALLPSFGGRQPRIVLLTPGPYNETHFEHVFLARQLGVTLVEGNDLTVRDRQVFMKTLSGLERVGVILRRLDDDFCDPLELRTTSALGVAGLVEAIRAGNIVVANALGSGLLEAPAFKPFLPGLTETLLGEKPLLDDLATWWGGDATGQAHILAHLDHLTIRPAFKTSSMAEGEPMTASKREALAARIAARPMDFVGQERLPPSTAPVWNGHKLEPRPVVLRVFVASVGHGYVVLPGGLTRSSASEGPVVSMQLGSGSKDTWVVGGGRESDTARVTALPPPTHRRPPVDELPSRVADGLFWVGRYAERTDCAVRVLRTLLIGITDGAQPWRARDVEPILNLATWLELVPLFDGSLATQPITLVQAALLDPNHPGGIIANLQRLLAAARGVRDRLPSDCWRIFVALERHTEAPVGRAPPIRLQLRLEELMTLGLALSGAIGETMHRDAGWRFVEIGKRLERAIYLVTMMRGLPTAPRSAASTPRIEERRLLSAMLALTDLRGPAESGSADQPEGALDRGSLIRAVLANEHDPRSLVYQLAALTEQMAALPRPNETTAGGQGLLDLAVSLAASARAMVFDAILEASRPRPSRAPGMEEPDALRSAFARLEILLPQISDLLTQAYFTHVIARTA
jgi:uncharacterized circularly permuted ATP-grasp superfamily protein/uncharacterized alpha-E superfamily protein